MSRPCIGSVHGEHLPVKILTTSHRQPTVHLIGLNQRFTEVFF